MSSRKRVEGSRRQHTVEQFQKLQLRKQERESGAKFEVDGQNLTISDVVATA